ncbi:type II toxin-antitoxin system Phd/YefM family antitoxin [Kineococcus sp. SYSU DK018]|uniref:type II toxin-antitoxin system Phd/YefM family antitoxin n=1 Tax=Kineococcus sp. SYSU DK018 TaxID=3383139 RepID=UPI003D7EEBC1
MNVHEAKTHLSRLLEAVERGEDVVIARSGKPVARLVPARSRGARRPGSWKGQAAIAADFDRTSDELVAAFHEDVDDVDDVDDVKPHVR